MFYGKTRQADTALIFERNPDIMQDSREPEMDLFLGIGGWGYSHQHF